MNTPFPTPLHSTPDWGPEMWRDRADSKGEAKMGHRPRRAALLRQIDSWLAAAADAELVRDGVMHKLIADIEAIRTRFRALADGGAL